jgi:hypothetical protein
MEDGECPKSMFLHNVSTHLSQQTSRCHNTEDHNINIHRRRNFKYYDWLFV